MTIHDVITAEYYAAKLAAAIKARPRKSPHIALYTDWEKQVQATLLAHWKKQSKQILKRLRKEVKADIFDDDDWWLEWTFNYRSLLLSPLEQGGGIGAATAAAALFADYGLSIEDTSLAVTEWARSYAGKLAKGLTKTDKTSLRSQLAAWTEAQEGMPELIERVDSFLNNPIRAEAIAVTEATRTYAEGNMVAWRESEVVNGRVWLTAMDELVCPICRPLHGQVTSFDDQVWHHPTNPGLSVGLSVKNPPAHTRCRCEHVAWVKELPW